MARISTYVIDGTIVDDDKVIGSDANNSMITKNYTVRDLAAYIGHSIGNNSFVPYINANNDVNLGAYSLTTTNLIIGNQLFLGGSAGLPGQVPISNGSGSPAFWGYNIGTQTLRDVLNQGNTGNKNLILSNTTSSTIALDLEKLYGANVGLYVFDNLLNSSSSLFPNKLDVQESSLQKTASYSASGIRYSNNGNNVDVRPTNYSNQTLSYPSNSGVLVTSVNNIAADSTGNIILSGLGLGTVTSVAVTPGTGISASVTDASTTPNITITNTAPDQVVVLNEGAGIDITGAYPSFTIAATGTSGVSSVTASTPLASSGGATPNITIQQASGSQDGYLSLGDWTIFNNKQNTLTNPITGTGTTNFVTKWSTTGSTLTDSIIFDSGTNVGIGTASPSYKLHVIGTGFFQSIDLEQAGTPFITFKSTGTGSNNKWTMGNQYDTGCFNIQDDANSTNIPIRILKTSGNVIIGAANSSATTTYKLDVNGTGNFEGAIRIGNTPDGSGTFFDSYPLTFTGKGTAGVAQSANIKLDAFGVAGQEFLQLTSNGGIRLTSSGNNSLEIPGNVYNLGAGGLEITANSTTNGMTVGNDGAQTSGTLFKIVSSGSISKFSIDAATDSVTINNLAGTGTRMVVASSAGVLSTQTIPSGGGGLQHGIASGTDTYTVTISGVTSYAEGDSYIVRFTNGNTTGATLNINGLGVVPLYRNNDGPLLGGDILNNGDMLCVYDTSIPAFRVIGTSPNSLFAYVTNDDSVTITKGQVVYAFSGQGDRMTVKLANNVGDSTSAQTVGLVFSTSIAANAKGLIIMQGLLDGLSILPTATWNDGDPVYLGATAGSITPTKQYAPAHLVYLGFVTTASNGTAGRMYVRIQNGYELDELHNVQARTPTLKDTLWYDNTVSPAQWKTASIPTILGYTPVSGTGTTNELSYFTAASTIGSLTTATYPSLTELSYVKGVTSDIQTQINSKVTNNAWVDYSATSTIVGFTAYSVKKLQYKITAPDTMIVMFEITSTAANGAGTTTSFTLPFSASAWGTQYNTYRLQNNVTQTIGTCIVVAGSNVVTFYPGGAIPTNWTTATTRQIQGVITINI